MKETICRATCRKPSMRGIFVFALVGLCLSIYGTANAWTTHDFRIGWSDVYSYSKGEAEHSYHWHVTTHPLFTRNSPVYKILYGRQYITQVMYGKNLERGITVELTNKDGLKTINHPKYVLGLERAKEVFAELEYLLTPKKTIIDRIFGLRTVQLTVCYHVELEQITIIVHPEDWTNRALNERIAKRMSKLRAKLIESGKFKPSEELLMQFENFERYTPPPYPTIPEKKVPQEPENFPYANIF